MEVAPVYGYSEENQGVMLYVKDMHDFYRESLEIEEVSVRNREIIIISGPEYGRHPHHAPVSFDFPPCFLIHILESHHHKKSSFPLGK